MREATAFTFISCSAVATFVAWVAFGKWLAAVSDDLVVAWCALTIALVAWALGRSLLGGR